jgi:glycerophosphoryl diester phosphodiesterase
MSPFRRDAPPSDELEVIAHRGYSARAPENTLVAVERAIAAGADAVEWDIHVAACGTPVLMHDEALERTSDGTGPVRERNLAELHTLDAGAWFDAAFAGERIPRLDEALSLVRGRVRRVYTEIKGYRDTDDLDHILEIVRVAGIEGHVFISLDWAALAHIRVRDGGVEIGYVVDTRAGFDEALERANGDGHAILDLDRRLVLKHAGLADAALDRGFPLAVWTVNDPDEAERLLAAGVTRFTTDEVQRLVAWKATTS